MTYRLPALSMAMPTGQFICPGAGHL
jgi:hypothetical protein